MSLREKENRRHPRVQFSVPVRIRIGSGPESGAKLIDISEGGASLSCSQPIAEGTALELRFHLYTGGHRVCQVFSEVRHSYFDGSSHVVGVKFTRYDPETAAAIREFISETKPG